MSYTKSEQGQSTTFVTKPEAVPVPWGLAALSVLPVVIFLFISLTAAFVFAAIFAAPIWARMKILPAARKFRSPSTFSVSPEEISIEGRSIRLKDIHRAVIRNHVLSGDNPSNFVTLHQGIGAMTGAASAAANAKFKGLLADISYRVDVEAGGVPHTLAGGLNESTAFAVLSDVSHILGLNQPMTV
jgi:hypothetical protein